MSDSQFAWLCAAVLCFFAAITVWPRRPCGHRGRPSGGPIIPPQGGSGTAKRLKTLAEHEAGRKGKTFANVPYTPTGVACPHCGAEIRAYVDCPLTADYRRRCFCEPCCKDLTIA